MKKIITLAAMIAFSGGAFASEGNTLLDDIDIATSTSGYTTGGNYSYNEGTSILDDATNIAMIETMTAPSAVGSNDSFIKEDSALGSMFYSE